MGRDIAGWEVSQKLFEEEAPLLRRRYGGNLGKADLIAHIAISQWREYEANRYDSPDSGAAEFSAVTPAEVMEKFAEKANSRRTMVVPMTDKADYTTAKKIINVKLNNHQWQEINRGFGIHTFIMDNYPEYSDKLISAKPIHPSGLKNHFNDLDAWTVKSKVQTSTAGGKTRNVYHVCLKDGRRTHHFLEDGYPTQAAARAAALDFMNKNPYHDELQVKGCIEREDGSNLVQVKRFVTSATAKVEVEYLKVTAEKPREKGWMVYFSYHS